MKIKLIIFLLFILFCYVPFCEVNVYSKDNIIDKGGTLVIMFEDGRDPGISCQQTGVSSKVGASRTFIRDTEKYIMRFLESDLIFDQIITPNDDIRNAVSEGDNRESKLSILISLLNADYVLFGCIRKNARYTYRDVVTRTKNQGNTTITVQKVYRIKNLKLNFYFELIDLSNMKTHASGHINDSFKSGRDPTKEMVAEYDREWDKNIGAQLLTIFQPANRKSLTKYLIADSYENRTIDLARYYKARTRAFHLNLLNLIATTGAFAVSSFYLDNPKPENISYFIIPWVLTIPIIIWNNSSRFKDFGRLPSCSWGYNSFAAGFMLGYSIFNKDSGIAALCGLGTGIIGYYLSRSFRKPTTSGKIPERITIISSSEIDAFNLALNWEF